MSLSKQERGALVAALIDDARVAALKARVLAGEVEPKAIASQVPALLNDHPRVGELETGDQRAILGMLTGRIRSLAPPPPKASISRPSSAPACQGPDSPVSFSNSACALA